MNHSLSYYIILLVLKIKGLKKDFSKDPIDYKKIRKEDIHNPKEGLFRKHEVSKFNISNTQITEIKQESKSNKLLIFVHGGAFISGPSKHHWDTVQEILKNTKHTVWMCDYPKAPEHKIAEISDNIDKVYEKAIEKYPARQITFIGDSAGGTLIIALMQRLAKTAIKLPHKIILVTPVMDSSMSNPQIAQIDKTDPMLSKAGVLSAKKMCAENNNLSDPMISPINGSFDRFPTTILYLATNDITYPDQKLAVQKLIDTNVNIEVIEGKNMPHIWPLLPVMKEAKLALKKIIDSINE